VELFSSFLDNTSRILFISKSYRLKEATDTNIKLKKQRIFVNASLFHYNLKKYLVTWSSIQAENSMADDDFKASLLQVIVYVSSFKTQELISWIAMGSCYPHASAQTRRKRRRAASLRRRSGICLCTMPVKCELAISMGWQLAWQIWPAHWHDPEATRGECLFCVAVGLR